MGVTIVGMALAVLALVLVVWMRTAYLQALLGAVHAGLVEVFAAPTPGIQKPTLDADAQGAIFTALSDPIPARRALAATMLGRLGSDGAAHWGKALADEEPAVRAAALHAIADRPESVPAARTLLGDPSPAVRRRAAETLERHRAALDPSSAALADPDPIVRASAAILTEAGAGRAVIHSMLASPDLDTLVAALEALVRFPELTGYDPAQFAAHPDRKVRAAAARGMKGRVDRVDVLREMLDDPSIRVRRSAAETLADDPNTVDALIEVLSYGSVRACDAALQALADRGLGGDRCRRWIAGEVDRARYLRRHRMVLAENPTSETRAYLGRLLRAREARLETWALLALTVPETEDVIPLLKRGIWAEDPETSAQALEALDSLEPHPLLGGLIALLEDDSTPPDRDPGAALLELASDRDGWIRALAVWCLIEDRHPSVNEISARLAADPSPLVRVVLARSGLSVDETRTFDLVDRVLALQRVPIFSEIDPEDLERIADVAIERTYQPQEPIYRYGAEGDEMLVIVSGDAEIRRPDGRPIGAFGAGETVGELALLRRGSRAADVSAGPVGLHGLALKAAEFEVILEERPPVAMAMLATLAERLGRM
jgi:HEAT repeat protein